MYDCGYDVCWVISREAFALLAIGTVIQPSICATWTLVKANLCARPGVGAGRCFLCDPFPDSSQLASDVKPLNHIFSNEEIGFHHLTPES